MKLLGLLRFLGDANDVFKTDDTATAAPSFVQNILNPVFGVLKWLLPVIMILIGLVGIIYSIVLGLNFAKAESSDQRDAAKKKLISVVIGVLVIIIAILLVYIFIYNVYDIFGWVTETAASNGK